jgi:hypothetical protein
LKKKKKKTVCEPLLFCTRHDWKRRPVQCQCWIQTVDCKQRVIFSHTHTYPINFLLYLSLSLRNITCIYLTTCIKCIINESEVYEVWCSFLTGSSNLFIHFHSLFFCQQLLKKMGQQLTCQVISILHQSWKATNRWTCGSKSTRKIKQ